MSDFKEWTDLVLGESDTPKPDLALIELLNQANKLGALHPTWVEFRRQNKTGEFSKEFEESGAWSGSEESRWKQWEAYLASDEYHKSNREKCLARLQNQNESLEEGVSADDRDYAIAWTLLVDELGRQGVAAGNRGELADKLVACLRDASPVAVVSDAELKEYSLSTPKLAAAVENVCEALEEVKIRRHCLTNAITVTWSYEADKYRCNVPNEETKWFDNKTAARKYAFSAKNRTDDQPRGYRLIDFTKPRGQQQWAGGKSWGPIKGGRGKKSAVEDTESDQYRKLAIRIADSLGIEPHNRPGKNLFPHGINKAISDVTDDHDSHPVELANSVVRKLED